MRSKNSTKNRKFNNLKGLPGEFRPQRLRTPKPKREPTVKCENNLMVRSNFEKKAISFFEKHQIKFRYEPLMLLGGKQYRPDFFLPELNLFIELCGMNHMVYYRERQKQKKRVYDKYNLKAIFIDCNKLAEIEPRLKKELAQFL